MKLHLPSTRFPSSEPSPLPSQDYLLGFRGLLVIQYFLFVFLQLFLPSTVADSKDSEHIGVPLYQTILRKTLSVIFWNESLIYSFIIFLSARTICLPFFADPNRRVCASSIFRRGIRLWIPSAISLSLAAVIFSKFDNSTSVIAEFLTLTKNETAMTPLRLSSFLHAFNSLFDLFWTMKDYASQAANRAFPSGTLWVISVLFQQSYTVYMTMIIAPYTRPSWRVKALLAFISTAWWVQSWAWYSISGLLVADAVMHMDLKSRALSGWRFRVPFVERAARIPSWILYMLLILAGLIMQYLFIAWRPEFRNQEVKGHTGLYNSGSLNQGVNLEQPLARDDTYLVVMGVGLMVETYGWVQGVLRWRGLVGLGRRSFSVFLVQPLLVYTVGIKLFMHLQGLGWTHSLATLVSFIVCVPLVALGAEIFYRFVDLPSIWAAKRAFEFITS
ncbi:hypothetical protein GQ43DRAFT_379645 [Delitschia confertaspora ATCC 74209]|uniref:Acyltransferase 3 domain-containing protein n=1 Tax=Delitschia confertaspora ATCC 74209 TaxID=1513339 RepID=A0A9P4JF66_9PLEO|nr:hypothetical protein GQ43DRAFT_379645 [Delitschia confertaspora ATCC 74209]